MTGNFFESETKENLMRAFAGESQARNRYTIAAEKAREKGMYTIADVFLYTADQERAHAERFYELLKEFTGSTIQIDGTYPVDQQDTLEELLRAAEHNEKNLKMCILRLEVRQRQKVFWRRRLHSSRLQKLSIPIRSDFRKSQKCWKTAPITAGKNKDGGSVQTAVISMTGSRHHLYVRCAVTRRDIFFHMNMHLIKEPGNR